MITIDDVREQLADRTPADGAPVWDDDRLAAVLAAEAAAQRSILDPTSDSPAADLDAALLRRVVHNLTTSTSKTVERIGIHADGVRELERPWSRHRASERADSADSGPEPAPKPRRKRAAKKTAAKSATTSKENS